MKIKEKDRLRIFKDYIKHCKKIDDLCDGLSRIIGIEYESPFMKEIQYLTDQNRYLMAQQLGTTQDTIAWFEYDNEYGAKGAMCEFDGKKIKVIDEETFLETI